MSGVVRQNEASEAEGNDAFRMRMKGQCHEIERYRLAVLRDDSRILSLDEAALEWIERYAASFDPDGKFPYQ